MNKIENLKEEIKALSKGIDNTLGHLRVTENRVERKNLEITKDYEEIDNLKEELKRGFERITKCENRIEEIEDGSN